MRRTQFFGVAAVVALVVALAWAPWAAGEARPPCCQNTVTGQVVPLLMADCAFLGDAWVNHPGPCTPEEQPATWWDTLLRWADGRVIYEPDAGTLAKLLAWLTALVAAVQALKKLVEGSGTWGWLIRLIPGWSKVAAAIAHGWGPVAMNVIITGGVMLIAALQSPGLTLGEVLRIVIAIVGTDQLYRILRLIFPKGPA